MSKIVRAFLASILLLTGSALGQAKYTATGPGWYLNGGAEASLYQADYGQRKLGGGTAFVDANGDHWLGIEAEARYLRIHQDSDVSETTYLGGLRASWPRSRRYTPYVKFLVGAGKFNYPFNYATGSYFVLAPGAGVDLKIAESRWFLRADIEYQRWPQFTFGPLDPYGVSFGVSYRILGGTKFANVRARSRH